MKPTTQRSSPKKTEFLTETLLQINASKDLASIKKKLRQNGIGIE
jgi:hypothetical protein